MSPRNFDILHPNVQTVTQFREQLSFRRFPNLTVHFIGMRSSSADEEMSCCMESSTHVELGVLRYQRLVRGQIYFSVLAKVLSGTCTYLTRLWSGGHR